jgi:hypothetical protein
MSGEDMKKRLHIFALALLCALFMFAPPAEAQRVRVVDAWLEAARNSDLYRDLLLLSTEGKTREVQDRIRDTLAQNPQLNVAYAMAVFLTQHTYMLADDRQFNNKYFMLYSDVFFYIARATQATNLQRIFLQNAMAGLLQFENLSMMDNFRCVDRSGWGVYKATYINPRLKQMTPVYAAFTTVEFKKVIADTLAFEEQHVARPANATVCGATPDDTKIVSDKEDTSTYVGTYALSENRKLVHDTLIRFWSKRYEEITQVQLQ